MPDLSSRRALGVASHLATGRIEVALIHGDGAGHLRPGPGISRPLSPDFCAEITRRAVRRRGGQRPGAGRDRDLARRVSAAHADAVCAFLARHALAPEEIAALGLDGLTLAADPEAGAIDPDGRPGPPAEIGDPGRLAGMLDLPVISGFRERDVAAGGAGGPLAPLALQALVLSAKAPRPAAVLELGPRARLVWVGTARLIAGEAGPGTALLDALPARARAEAGLGFDGGPEAETGLVARWLDHPGFDRPPPRRLPAEALGAPGLTDLPPARAGATALAFVAGAALRLAARLPRPPAVWYVAGGAGWRPALMARLGGMVAAPVRPLEALGLRRGLASVAARRAAVTAGHLALAAAAGQRLTLPETTGAAAAPAAALWHGPHGGGTGGIGQERPPTPHGAGGQG